jgi:hypothetical protein
VEFVTNLIQQQGAQPFALGRAALGEDVCVGAAGEYGAFSRYQDDRNVGP